MLWEEAAEDSMAFELVGRPVYDTGYEGMYPEQSYDEILNEDQKNEEVKRQEWYDQMVAHGASIAKDGSGRLLPPYGAPQAGDGHHPIAGYQAQAPLIPGQPDQKGEEAQENGEALEAEEANDAGEQGEEGNGEQQDGEINVQQPGIDINIHQPPVEPIPNPTRQTHSQLDQAGLLANTTIGFADTGKTTRSGRTIRQRTDLAKRIEEDEQYNEGSNFMNVDEADEYVKNQLLFVRQAVEAQPSIEDAHRWVCDLGEHRDINEFVYRASESNKSKQLVGQSGIGRKLKYTYDEMTRMSDVEQEQAVEAAQKELEGLLHGSKTFKEVTGDEIPAGTQLLPLGWGFTLKMDPQTGLITRVKGRLYVRGDCGKPDLHFDPLNIYSATPSFAATKIVMCVAARQGYHCGSADVTQAFTKAPTTKTIYTCMAPGFNQYTVDGRRRAYLMLTNLYGNVDAAATWLKTGKAQLKIQGWRASPNDGCLFRIAKHKETGEIYKDVFPGRGHLVEDSDSWGHTGRLDVHKPSHMFTNEAGEETTSTTVNREIPKLKRLDKSRFPCTLPPLSNNDYYHATMVLYVDDLFAAGDNYEFIRDELDKFIEVFGGEVKMNPTIFLGMAIEFDRNKHTLTIQQPVSQLKLLEGMKMNDCKPSKIPVSIGISSEEEEELRTEKTAAERNKMKNECDVQSMNGQIGWLTHTMPELAYSYSMISRTVRNPTSMTITRIKQVTRYIQGQKGRGVFYGGKSSGIGLRVFVDSDLSEPSTGCTIIYFDGGPIGISVNRAKSATNNTCDAEAMELFNGVKDTMYYTALCDDIGVEEQRAVPIGCDNIAIKRALQNPYQASRLKHIRYRLVWMSERQEVGDFKVYHVSGEDNPADVGTKLLVSPSKWEHLVPKVNGYNNVYKGEDIIDQGKDDE